MRILSVDVEKNGLHGVAFAVGAVLLDQDGKELSSFRGRAPIEGVPRTFVQEKVLPALDRFPETHETAKAMRADFWAWFHPLSKDAHVFADCGWPSEARFFIALAEDDLVSRYVEGPYPLHEVATLLLAVGVDPDIERQQYAKDRLGGRVGNRHDPWWDAFVSGQCAVKALEALGRLPHSTPT
jgi:hypothetical protein